MTKDLTEQWKNGELEEYKKYYCKTKWFEDIFQARYYNKGTEGEWWALENERYMYNNIYHTKDIEVLAPVPSYEKWNAVLESNESLFETIQVLKKRLVEVAEENAKLKELLKDLIDEAEGALQAIQKDCESDDWSVFHYPEVQYFYNLKDKIEVLK